MQLLQTNPMQNKPSERDYELGGPTRGDKGTMHALSNHTHADWGEIVKDQPQKDDWEERFDEKFPREDGDTIYRFCRLDFDEGDGRSIKSFIKSHFLPRKEVEKNLNQIDGCLDVIVKLENDKMGAAIDSSKIYDASVKSWVTVTKRLIDDLLSELKKRD